MANKFREFVEAKNITVKIHFPSKDYAKTFGDIIKNIENNLIFNTSNEANIFKVKLINVFDFNSIEENGINVLVFNTFLSKISDSNFLNCQYFHIKTTEISTKSFYCEIIDNEVNKLAYKTYRNDLVSIVKQI